MKVLFLILMFTCLFSFSQRAATVERKKISEYIESVRTKYNIPGIVVAIADENGLQYLESFGDVATDDLFQIGSLSKSFTGLLTLKFNEQGLLNIDDPVVKYLDWFEYKNKKVSDKITIRNLLYQTSGLTTNMGRNFLKRDSKDVRANLANVLRDFELESADGNEFIYSNLNYRLLGYIIEDLSNDSYGNVLRKEITKPFSMTNTTGFVTDNFVKGFQYFLYYPIVPIGVNYHKDDIPVGYIGSTAADMSRYLTVLMNGYNGTEDGLIDQTTARLLFAPNPLNRSGYAMGWMTWGDAHSKTFAHDGATQGYSTYMTIVPEINKNVIVLSNAFGHNPWEIGQGILNIVQDKEPVDQSKVLFYFIRSFPLLVLLHILILIYHMSVWFRLKRPILFTKRILPNIPLVFGVFAGLFWTLVMPVLLGATLMTAIEFDRTSGYCLILLSLSIIAISFLSYFNKGAKKGWGSDLS
ncbi:class A beta-lactamase-related serine hydrolase [Puteibacter caeruleilacunae]|nr:class A beta-lactamase-related serine hydrolase [Puteibacter caeruleilacunae]